MKRAEIVCSFCHKPESEVAKMVGEPTGKAFICDECIKICYSVVSKDEDPAK